MTQASAAPYPIVLAGKTFLVSPLTDKELDLLDNWVRKEHIQTAVKAAESLPKVAHDAVIAAATMQASSLQFMSAEGARIIRSLKGVAFLLWCGLRKEQPNLTVEEIEPLLLDPRNVKEANRVFDELNVKPLQEVAAKAGKAGVVAEALAASLQKKASTKRSSASSRKPQKKSRPSRRINKS